MIARVESMINVGCKFGPNDLAPDAWDHLILLAQERQWIRKKVDDQKKKTKAGPEAGLTTEGKAAIQKQRRELGIPPPGQSIFVGQQHRVRKK
jgi:hypothetical protein